MTENDKRFLTEVVLKECWDHGIVYTHHSITYITGRCVNCKREDDDLYEQRTFTIRDDMMDLYEAIVRDGKWEEFVYYGFFIDRPENIQRIKDRFVDGIPFYDDEYFSWLHNHSADPAEYGPRCQMVRDFYKELSNNIESLKEEKFNEVTC